MSVGIVRKDDDPHVPVSLYETESGKEEGDKTVRRALLASDVSTVDEAALLSFYISVWPGMWVSKRHGDYCLAECSDCDALVDKVGAIRLANLDQKGAGSLSAKLLLLLPPSRRPKSSTWWPIANAMGLETK